MAGYEQIFRFCRKSKEYIRFIMMDFLIFYNCIKYMYYVCNNERSGLKAKKYPLHSSEILS